MTAPTILLVDDDQLLRSMYHKKLTFEHFTVFEAANGKEAMALAEKEKPQLILLDIMMPGGMNGFEVLEQLKRNPVVQHIPVVMFTNLSPEKDTALAMGATDYIVKADASLDEVIAIIKKYLPQV